MSACCNYVLIALHQLGAGLLDIDIYMYKYPELTIATPNNHPHLTAAYLPIYPTFHHSEETQQCRPPLRTPLAVSLRHLVVLATLSVLNSTVLVQTGSLTSCCRASGNKKPANKPSPAVVREEHFKEDVFTYVPPRQF